MKQENTAAVTPHPRTSRGPVTGALPANVVALFVSVVFWALAVPAVAHYDQLNVTYYYVGPGNCVLVQCPTAAGTDFLNLIIDCGSHRIREKPTVLESMNDVVFSDPAIPENTVNNLILTHPDRDHYNFLIELDPLFKFPTGVTGDVVNLHLGNMNQVYAGGMFTGYKEKGLSEAIQFSATDTIHGQTHPYEVGPIAVHGSNKSKPYQRKRYSRTLSDVQALHFDPAATPTDLGLCGDAQVFLLAANSNPAAIATDTNSQSLIVALKYAGKVFLFPGDATNEAAQGHALQTALDSWARLHGQTLSDYTTFVPALKVDYLMAPHHGSKEDESDWDGWAKVTQPEVVIYSADPELTGYGHPSQSSFEAYLPYLKSTAAPRPFTYWTAAGEQVTTMINKAAIGLSNTGDFVVNVASTGTTSVSAADKASVTEVSVECHGDRAEAWGCGTDLLESIEPEEDEPAHRPLMADSEILEESFEDPMVPPAPEPTPDVVSEGWIHCQDGGIAHEEGMLGDTPWGSQALSVDDSAATVRGLLGALTAEHTYRVSAELMAAGTGSASVDLELLSLGFDELENAACDNSLVIASTSATLAADAGWESVSFFFTADVDHIDMAKDLAVRVRRTDALGDTVKVYADNVRVVETRTLDESFESPVVDDSVEESVPAAGWVGCSDSTLHGLRNEAEGTIFETAHGRQAYELATDGTGLTTEEGLIGSLVAGQTYTISFDVKTTAAGGSFYLVELVAFTDAQGDVARAECGNRPGTVLAEAEGLASGFVDWTSVQFSYEALASDPELSDDVAVRLYNDHGSPLLYDNVKLTVSESTYATTEEPILILRPDPGSDNHIFHPNGSNYFPVEADCVDGKDGELPVSVTGTVNPDVDGRYDQIFSCEDSDMNRVERTIETEVHTPEWGNCPIELANSQRLTWEIVGPSWGYSVAPAPEVVDGNTSTYLEMTFSESAAVSWLGTFASYMDNIYRVEVSPPGGSYTLWITECDRDDFEYCVNYRADIDESGNVINEWGRWGYPRKEGLYVYVTRGPDQTLTQLSEVVPYQICEDTDFDGIPNDVDTDDDNDGVPDSEDDRPRDDTETVDTDGDAIGNNADPDDDGDGLLDVEDNCPLHPNVNQEDADEDGIGDACDSLSNGVAISDLAGSAGEVLYYYIDLPTDVRDLRIEISGGTGDSDLYVRYEQVPTLSLYDCRPYTPTSDELCAFSFAQAGRWHVMIRAYEDFSDINLTATWGDPVEENEMVPGVPHTDLSAASGQELEYFIEVPEGASNLRFDIAGTGGDADLYVRYGSPPTTSTWDCRPYTSTSTENCTFAQPDAGTWYVMVRAYDSFSDLTLTADYDLGGGGPVSLENGVPVPDLEAYPDEGLHFTIEVPPGAGDLRFETSGGSGDVDLYVRHGEPATASNYDCRSYRYGNDEICRRPVPAAGTWHVWLRPYSAFSGVTLTASFEDPGDGGELISGETESDLMAPYGQELPFFIQVPEDAQNLRVETTGGSGDADLYLRFGSPATTSTFDCRSDAGGNGEVCEVASPAAGTWYVMVRGYQEFTALELTATVTTEDADDDGIADDLEHPLCVYDPSPTCADPFPCDTP